MNLHNWRFWRGYGNDSGSITLESTLVLPVVMTVMFLIVIFTVLVTDRAALYYRASIASERVAFNWSNSSKAPATGAYPDGRYDGLYWRLFEDAALTRLFGLASPDRGRKTLTFPSDADGDEGLVSRKLKMGATMLEDGLAGELSYRNDLLRGVVSADVRGNTVYEPIARLKGTADLTAGVDAVTVDPAEWMRSFDLIRYYAAKSKNPRPGAGSYRAEGASILGKLGGVR